MEIKLSIAKKFPISTVEKPIEERFCGKYTPWRIKRLMSNQINEKNSPMPINRKPLCLVC